jgi:hypothetical protein
MRTFLLSLTCCVAVAVLFGGMMVIDVTPSVGAEKEKDCTWGALKCCFADPPCGVCCARPKDPGYGTASWVQAALRVLVWSWALGGRPWGGGPMLAHAALGR